MRIFYSKYLNEAEQKRTREMKLRPNPKRIKGQLFQSI
jgi:hypothetical protein